MRQQLSAQAVLLLAGALVLFWIAVAMLVRRHRNAGRRAQDTHAEPRP